MTPETPTTLRRSLRPRFSLKLLFLLITLVAAYFGYSLHRHHREQEKVWRCEGEARGVRVAKNW
jgi:hypothetical protein